MVVLHVLFCVPVHIDPKFSECRMARVLLGGLVLGIICSLVQSFDLGFIPMLITRAIEGLSHLAIVVAARCSEAA